MTSGVCQETRNRIRLSITAYAYEFENETIMSDHEFDALCLKINLSKSTARPDLDEWFRKNFNPATGMWIRQHPEIPKLRGLFYQLYPSKRPPITKKEK